MRNFMSAIRGGVVLYFHAEQPYFHEAGAYLYAKKSRISTEHVRLSTEKCHISTQNMHVSAYRSSKIPFLTGIVFVLQKNSIADAWH